MIAYLPAKGFSKRVYRKNVREFCGKPLIEWTLIQLETAKHIDMTYVSTDDEVIAEIANKYTTTVVWRDYLQGLDDTAGVPQKHWFQWMDAHGGLPEEYLDIFCTSPLRFPGDIDRVIERSQKGYGTRVMTMGLWYEIDLYRTHPNGQASCVIGDKGVDRYLFGTNATHVTRTAPARATVEDASKIRTDTNMDTERLILMKPEVVDYVTVPWWQTLEADFPDTFELCEWLMEKHILKGQGDEMYYAYQRTTT